MKWKWAWVRGIAGTSATIGLITNVSFGGDLNIFNIAFPGKQADQVPPPIGIYNCDDLEKKSYVGHKEQLGALRLWMRKKAQSPEETNSIPFNVLVVNGMGGVGKTTLLRRFVKEVVKEEPPTFKNVIWIPAESRESMSATFKDLANGKFQIPLKDDEDRLRDEGSIVEEVYKKLLLHGTLMVFDNAECYETEVDSSKGNVLRDGIKEFMPKMVAPPQEYPKILISSRNKKWDNLTSQSLSIGIFSDQECSEYIKTRLREVADAESKWKEVAEYFGNLIIAIESAVDAILFQFELSKNDVKDYSVDEFLSTLSKFETDPGSEDAEDEYHVLGKTYRPLLTLWKSTFEMLESKQKHGKSALHILDTLAFLSPSGVPIKLLNDIYEGSMDKQEKLIAMDTLQKLSLISVSVSSASSKIIQAHRLLQQVRMQELVKRDLLESRLGEFSERYEKTLGDINYKNPDLNIYVENGVTVFNHLKNNLSTNNLTIKSIVFKIPETLREFDAQFTVQAYDSLRTYLSQQGWDMSNPIYRMVSYRLTNALIVVREYDRGFKIVNELYAYCLDNLEKDNLETVRALENLGKICGYQGDYDAALKAYEKVLAVESGKFDPDHRTLLITKHNYACVFYRFRNYKMALPLFEEVYTLSRKKLGENHLDTINELSFVAICLGKEGRYEEALKMHEKVHVVRKDVLGATHPRTVRSKRRLDETKELIRKSNLVRE